jgi:hypothetical protein
MSKPSIPAPPPPPQEVKAPDSLAGPRGKRKPAGMGGTMLTGPTGVTTSSLNTGGATLLGG